MKRKKFRFSLEAYVIPQLVGRPSVRYDIHSLIMFQYLSYYSFSDKIRASGIYPIA